MEYKVAIWFFFDFFNTKNAKKIPKLLSGNPDTRWNMISPNIFAGALTIFAGALPPWAVGPTLVTGLVYYTLLVAMYGLFTAYRFFFRELLHMAKSTK